MTLKYLKSGPLGELQKNILSNVVRYEGDEPFLNDFFKDRDYLSQSRLEVADFPSLHMPVDRNETRDLENAMLVHAAMPALTPTQAADGRLWAYLCHERYWSYMRKRWDAKGAQTPQSYILEHYFVTDARSLVRNGLCRLWLFGHATYDSTASDPYRLTRIMLRSADRRQNIIETQFWRNPMVIRELLERTQYWQDRGHDFSTPRTRYRNLCSMINAYGGSVLLDVLDRSDLAEIIDRIAIAQGATLTA